MKIVCNKEEFAALVRQCFSGARFEACVGCPFASVCTSGGDLQFEDQIMTRIEDICEIEVSDG